jgi:hypothetical protein
MLGGATPPARVAAPPRCRARRQPPARAMGVAISPVPRLARARGARGLSIQSVFCEERDRQTNTPCKEALMPDSATVSTFRDLLQHFVPCFTAPSVQSFLVLMARVELPPLLFARPVVTGRSRGGPAAFDRAVARARRRTHHRPARRYARSAYRKMHRGCRHAPRPVAFDFSSPVVSLGSRLGRAQRSGRGVRKELGSSRTRSVFTGRRSFAKPKNERIGSLPTSPPISFTCLLAPCHTDKFMSSWTLPS